MREPFSTRILKILCLGLAVLAICQFAQVASRKDPLATIRLPAAVPVKAAAAPEKSDRQTNSAPPAAAASRPPDLPAPVKARVDRITETEILAPVQRPLPMALIAIAGSEAYFRTAAGQMLWLEIGKEAGGVKLLEIGINRVSIEHEGRKKDFTLFGGLGSEPVLKSGKDTPP
jgi:hypothetical protein